MALYDVEILKAPSSTKALKQVCTLVGISEREIKDFLQNVPLVVKKSIPLSEAIDIERQLKRLGVSTRIVKVEADVETPEIEDAEDQPVDPQEVPINDDEIIEIPESEVTVLPTFQPAEPAVKIKRKKIFVPKKWINTLAFIFLVAVIITASLYIIKLTGSHQDEMEIALYVSQWRNTLLQQDLLLDKGFPPERIFYKLDEIEGKIERLLALIKSVDKAAKLRSEFDQARAETQSLIRDLAFRKSLDDHGYPIHPTCMLDRGMVRGASELPESTLLRIQLLGQDNVESVYYAARISGGTFKLIIDPSIERNIYDAKATVASLSQQPKEIQRWAERKFPLSEISEKYKPPGRRYSADREGFSTTGKHPSAPVERISTRTPSSNIGIPLSDPGTDPGRVREIERSITEWTETILNSQQHNLTVETDLLEEIYHRLLDLEVRIDQLIGLLESTIERNVWIERREDVYGSFINVRQEIGRLYDDFTMAENPFRLEESIRQRMREGGFRQTEVLVIDSPSRPDAFIIEIEISDGPKEELLVTMAQIVYEEMRNMNLKIDRINLRYEGKIMWWTLNQISEAIQALNFPEGKRRCALQLELSASSTALQ